MPIVTLRDVTESDLPIFYAQQLNPDATRMAAFPARDQEAFMQHWITNVLANSTGRVRTIVADGQVVGNIVSYVSPEVGREVGYWLGSDYWGKGIATQALRQFLQIDTVRPLYAHVAKHNLGSRRVLEKCGFVVVGVALIDEGEGLPMLEEVILALQ